MDRDYPEQQRLDTVGSGLQVERRQEAERRQEERRHLERSDVDRPASGARPLLTERPTQAPLGLPGRPGRHFVLVEPPAAAPTQLTPPASASATAPVAPPAAAPTVERLPLAPAPAGQRLGFLRDPRLKRALDVAGSAALLGALSPVLGACAVAVRISSPGPVLFRQKRIGKDGRPFEMLKFRTMHHNADQTAHQQYVARLIAGTADTHTDGEATVYKLVGDRRITSAGRWLRRLSLDELPQLVNVLRGDMSLVGPRPPLPYEVEHYTPRHLQRLAATPGITGLWQVSGRSRTTFEEMIDLDLSYIQQWTVGLDLRILLRTVPVVIFPDGN